MDYSYIMVMICSLLVGNSVFFAIYLFLSESKNRAKRIRNLLALVLLAFAIRISKSVVFIVFPEYANTLTSIGILGMFAIGPLFWYYTMALKSHVKIKLVHFIPTILMFFAIPWIYGKWLHYLYLISLAHMLVYMLSCGWFMNKKGLLKSAGVNDPSFWTRSLWSAIILIWMGFVMQAFIHDKVYYVGITFMEGLIFFIITLIAMRNFNIVGHPIKNGNVETSALIHLAEGAKTLLKERSMYTQSDLTIAMLAKEMGTTPHLLSKALNTVAHRSFPALLSNYRIAHAQELMQKPEYGNISIEGIAFESGFNSLSVFYDNFKKHHRITPAAYRKALLDNMEFS